MHARGTYDSELQMFVDRLCEPDPARLRFLRWLAERSWLEHAPAGRPPVATPSRRLAMPARSCYETAD